LNRDDGEIAQTNLRLQFSEKVSDFGGTLGLFTGISFISVLEFVFWLAKTTHFLASKR